MRAAGSGLDNETIKPYNIASPPCVWYMPSKWGHLHPLLQYVKCFDCAFQSGLHNLSIITSPITIIYCNCMKLSYGNIAILCLYWYVLHVQSIYFEKQGWPRRRSNRRNFPKSSTCDRNSCALCMHTCRNLQYALAIHVSQTLQGVQRKNIVIEDCPDNLPVVMPLALAWERG